MKKMTAAEIRDFNQTQIYKLAYQCGRISRQEIAEQLNLSMPTISQNLKLLEEKHLIERNGMFQSTGGRKSVAYTGVSNARVAVGTQISENHIRIAAIDLFGKIIKREHHQVKYVNQPVYYQTFGELVNAFCRSLNLSSQRILGVGIAIKGLLSADRTTVTQGVRLGLSLIHISMCIRDSGYRFFCLIVFWIITSFALVQYARKVRACLLYTSRCV